MSLDQITVIGTQMLALLACGVIFWRAEAALNSIRRDTRITVHAACYLMVVGSLAVAVWVASGAVPDLAVLILLIGFALRLLCERRSCPRGDLDAPCR